jgi:hypothetical protein
LNNKAPEVYNINAIPNKDSNVLNESGVSKKKKKDNKCLIL